MEANVGEEFQMQMTYINMYIVKLFLINETPYISLHCLLVAVQSWEHKNGLLEWCTLRLLQLIQYHVQCNTLHKYTLFKTLLSYMQFIIVKIWEKVVDPGDTMHSKQSVLVVFTKNIH